MKIEFCAAKLCILLLVGVSFSTNLSGQNFSDLTVKRADAAFEEGRMALAHEQYAILLSIDANNSVWHARFGAACTHDPASFDLARTHLLQADRLGIQESDYATEWSFYMGKSMHLGYEFDVAVTWLTEFLEHAKKKDPKRTEAEMRLRQCKAHLTGLQGMQQVHVLEKFEANRDLFFRFYELTTNAGRLVAIPEELRTKLDRKNNHQGQMQILPNVPFVLYSSYGESGESGLDLYRAQIMPNGGFGIPEKLPSPINSAFDDTTPTWSSQRLGQPSQLHFASNRPASLGGFDLFKCPFDLTQSADEWGFLDVTPMSYTINTTSNEWFYLPAGDGKRIWFASDREGDFEALQVYQIREHTTALAPVELNLSLPQDLAKAALAQSARLQLVNETDESILLFNSLPAGTHKIDATILLPIDESKSLRWEWVNAEGNAIEELISTEVFELNGLSQGQSILQEMDWNGHLNQSVHERTDVSSWSPELLRNHSMISVTDALAIETEATQSEVAFIPDPFANTETRVAFNSETSEFLIDHTGIDLVTRVETGGLETESVETETVETESAETEGVETENVETESTETESVETESVKTESVETETLESESAETESTETESVETESAETESAETESVETESVETESVETESANTETLESKSAETESVETENVETESTETESVETESAETESAETESVDTESAETESANTENVETKSTETESVETESAETKSAETESAEAESVETENVETESTETESVETESVKTESLEARGVGQMTLESESIEIGEADDFAADSMSRNTEGLEMDQSGRGEVETSQVQKTNSNELEENKVEMDSLGMGRLDSEKMIVQKAQNQYKKRNRAKKRRANSKSTKTGDSESTEIETEQAVMAMNVETDRAETKGTEMERTTAQNDEKKQPKTSEEKSNITDRTEDRDEEEKRLNAKSNRSKTMADESKSSQREHAEHEEGYPVNDVATHEKQENNETHAELTVQSKSDSVESNVSHSLGNDFQNLEDEELKNESKEKNELNITKTIDSNGQGKESFSNLNPNVEASEWARNQHANEIEETNLATTNPNQPWQQDQTNELKTNAHEKFERNGQHASNDQEDLNVAFSDESEKTSLGKTNDKGIVETGEPSLAESETGIESNSFQEKPIRRKKRRERKKSSDVITLEKELQALLMDNEIHIERERMTQEEDDQKTPHNSTEVAQRIQDELHEVALPDSPSSFRNPRSEAESLTESVLNSSAEFDSNQGISGEEGNLEENIGYTSSNNKVDSKSEEALENWLDNTSEAARAFIAQTFILDAATVTTGAPIEEVASKAIFPGDAVAYSVQVGAFRNRPEARYFGSFSPVIAVPLSSGIARYLTGIFETYEQAANARDAIRELGGFDDAFVVVYENGERIPMSEIHQPSTSSSTEIMENTVEMTNTNQGREPLPVEMMTGGREWSAVEGVWFSIQIGAFRGFPSPELIEDLCPCNRELLDGELTRWTTGLFDSLETALQSLEVIRKTLVKDAFIVAFADGKRVKIANAVELKNAVSINSARQVSYRIRVARFQGQIPVASAAKLLRLSETVPMRAWPLGGQTTYISLPYKEKRIAELALQRCLDAGFDAQLEEISLDN